MLPVSMRSTTMRKFGQCPASKSTNFRRSPTIFKSIGVTGQNASLLTTGVYGIIKLLGAMIWLLYLVDQLGRRPLLMIGSIGGALSMYYIGAYIAIAKPQDHPTSVITSSGKSASKSPPIFG